MATSIAIASGKGGVGKTSMSVNLSLTLAQMDKRTTLLDADFGMAAAMMAEAMAQQRTLEELRKRGR